MAGKVKVPTVPVDDDLGLVLNCAVRYAIGRKTYVSGAVPDYIKPLLPVLSQRTLVVMERDIRERGEDPFYTDMGEPYGDPKIDEPSWLNLLEDIHVEINRRLEAGQMPGYVREWREADEKDTDIV